ncbi:MAG: right-handed parallel beta-helix repeat-containing protein [Microthrixaceae bacterium]
MSSRRFSGFSTALLAAAVLTGTLAACTPTPPDPPDPSSTLIDCSRAAERVTLTEPSRLDPSCTYTGGFDISTSGVSLDCQGATIHGELPGAAPRGIVVMAPEGVALSDITVRNCNVSGYLNNIRILREGYRFFEEGEEYLTPTSNILLEDNHFSGSRGVGVYVDAYVEDVTIRDSTIDGAGSTGIYLETGSRRNLVEGNSIINNGYIENGPGGQRRVFSGINIWFWGVGREGLAIDGSYENVVRNNAFFNNSNGGLFLYKNCGEYPTNDRYFPRRFHSDDNLIEANTFVGGRNGVWVASRMAENTLPMECSDEAYVDEGLTRIVPDYAADNIVRENRFVDVTYGVRVEDDGTVVEGNTFESDEPGKHAVIVGTPYRTDVLGQPVTDTTIVDNTSTLAGNTDPYRWNSGIDGMTFTGNTALGVPAEICEGQDPPRQPMIFVIAAVGLAPGEEPPPPPDLTVPVLGELAPCAAE